MRTADSHFAQLVSADEGSGIQCLSVAHDGIERRSTGVICGGKLVSKVTERERIAALEAKLKQLKVRQQRKEARERSIATRRTRSQKLRRKILVGRWCLRRLP